jgi:hypothetical protein
MRFPGILMTFVRLMMPMKHVLPLIAAIFALMRRV